MPTYASLAELKTQALDQLDGIGTHDTALEARLAQATAAVNKYLGTPTNLTAAASGTRTIYGSGHLSLPLPAHTGTVTLVAAPAGHTVPDYVEQDGELVITDSAGVILRPWQGGLSARYDWPYATGGWTYGLGYTVTASWGYDADALAILKAVTLDLAVQLWRYRDAGGSETVGAEGGVVTVRSGLTPLHKLMLDPVRDLVKGRTVGVF